jgi:large conductance mechanosensitive channel
MSNYNKGDYKNIPRTDDRVRKSYESIVEYIRDIRYDFSHFIIDYNIIGLTAGIILGTVGNNTIKSIIDNIIMPLISPLLGSKGEWEDKTVKIGNIELRIGKFIGDIIYFLLVFIMTFAFLHYFFARIIMGKDNVSNLAKKWTIVQKGNTKILT